MGFLRGHIKTLVLLVSIALVRSAMGQTYKVTPDSSQEAPSQNKKQNQNKSKKETKATKAPTGNGKESPKSTAPKKAGSGQKSLGWGSNIQNARLGRAAEQALKKGDYSAALDYAQRGTQAAPDDPRLWFLLGYVARLSKRVQLSVDSYNRGLRIDPSSLDGMSGLAQTYGTAGRLDEAERLVTQVLAANPKRNNDAAFLGEILLRSRQYPRAITVLGGAEHAKPAARTELLIAIAYERMNQFDQAKRYLDLAKNRAAHNPEVLRSFAGYYRQTGDYAAAIASLKAIPHRTPEITAELAYTYQLDGKIEETATLYAQAANAAPGKLDLQLSAAQAEVRAGEPEAADPFLQRAAAIDADNYRLHAVRGQIARLDDSNEEAVSEFNAAIDRLPQNPPEGPLFGIQLHMSLVALYKTLEDDKSAQHHLEIAQQQIAAQEQGQPSADFLRLRSLIRMSSGDLQGAESDIKAALAMNPNDPNSLQLTGDVLVKMGRPEEALAVYKKVLVRDPKSQPALTALGMVSRQLGHNEEAEKYFLKLAAAHPKLYIPYLALGDMYTARHDFEKAQASYGKAFELSPRRALIVAGGMNAGIEGHQLPLADVWLRRATPPMLQEPHVLREKERYLNLTGDFKQSAEAGELAIQKLPQDRDVVVYLGYDLLHLERYDDLLALTQRYEAALPKEADIPLLAGYVYKHSGQLDQAQQAFTRAIDRNDKVATAYVSRGFVRNDLHQPTEAEADFKAAVRLDPKNGEAHLGLAYSSLNLHRSRVALRESELAEQLLGDSLAIHLIRATAYGDEGQLIKAAAEYREAIKYSPHDSGLRLALADMLYGLHYYQEAVTELQAAKADAPDRGGIYARLALVYAQLHERDPMMQNIKLAEDHAQAEPRGQSTVFLSTGEALSLMGDHEAAMQRFDRALETANGDRMSVRLAIGRLMAREEHEEDARRQIALAYMESAAGEADPPTGLQFLQTGDVFLATRDYPLAQDYFHRALVAGAPETSVKIGLANSYLAQGDPARAEAQISSLSNVSGDDPNYQYLLAKANILRQERQTAQALTAFAQASAAAGEDETANQEMLQTAGDEGLRIDRNLSLLSDFSVGPIFEDTTIYPLDAQLDVLHPLPGQAGLLPPPRSSLQTEWTTAYHLHFQGMPTATGFFQIRNARGQISLPSDNIIVNRNTTDYNFNFGVSPNLRLGTNVLSFNAGLQETIRRDSDDPVDMDQNLFRQFLYLSTTSFFNVISVKGFAIREAGPFTLKNQRSRDLGGALEFRVGSPWAKTALITGWGAHDLQYFPTPSEYYLTSAYLGFEHKISERISFKALAEDVRSWRVDGTRFATAQAFRPAGSVHIVPARNWAVDASFAYSRENDFHAYDAVQSGFAVSYAMPLRHNFNDDGTDVELTYPIHFSAGMQQENFFNFPGSNSRMFRPYLSISIF